MVNTLDTLPTFHGSNLDDLLVPTYVDLYLNIVFLVAR